MGLEIENREIEKYFYILLVVIPKEKEYSNDAIRELTEFKGNYIRNKNIN